MAYAPVTARSGCAASGVSESLDRQVTRAFREARELAGIRRSPTFIDDTPRGWSGESEDATDSSAERLVLRRYRLNEADTGMFGELPPRTT